jgi:hypothetical protein
VASPACPICSTSPREEENQEDAILIVTVFAGQGAATDTGSGGNHGGRRSSCWVEGSIAQEPHVRANQGRGSSSRGANLVARHLVAQIKSHVSSSVDRLESHWLHQITSPTAFLIT